MAAALPTLNAHEARVFGVLIEKSLTTPDHYPLSLNAATAGANQKSNRDPVVDYLEAEVHVTLQGLVMKHLVGRVSGAGSRTEKYRHNGNEALGLDDAGLAVLAELLMRGAQTAGELRGRANRMHPLPALDDLRAVLDGLLERGFVRRLPPAPGSRAERFGACLGPDTEPPDPAPGDESPRRPEHPAVPTVPGRAGTPDARIARLERELGAMRRDLSRLMTQLGVEPGDEADVGASDE